MVPSLCRYVIARLEPFVVDAAELVISLTGLSA
jgi:hypothetical protein